MRLVNFQTLDGGEHFGVLIVDECLSVAQTSHGLTLGDYLSDPAGTLAAVQELLDEGLQSWPMEKVRFLPAVRPPVILDCAVSPEHLRRSARVLLRRSLPAGLGRLVGPVAGALIDRATPRSGDVRQVAYYKGNAASISGDGATIPWPDYSGYVDIEPELAFVTGYVPKGASIGECVEAIRGYVIFNDASARDVQLAEMVASGLTTSKDFDGGNGLGPYLTTPDELPDTRALGVTVEFNSGRASWTGSTSCYSMSAPEVLASLTRRQSIAAGTVIGMGTVAGCCGLDRDEWLDPGEEFAITIDGLGTLRQRFSTPRTPPTSRWGPRAVKAERRPSGVLSETASR